MLTRVRPLATLLLLSALLVGSVAHGQPRGFRWLDDDGNVHYAARRDQVPERYRGQLGPIAPGESTPHISGNPTGRPGVASGCILRLRGTERRRGTSHSYADCDTCRAALQRLGEEEKRRAECFASSIADELGKGSR